MNLKNIFSNLVVFAAMYAILLLIITLSFDHISPIIKARKIASDKRISATAFSGVANQKAIFSDSRKAPKQYQPFLAWKQSPYTSKYVNIDKDGFRKTPEQNHDTRKIKVGVFGSSPIWGAGVKDDQTMPAFLAQSNKNYTVKNYAQPGYTSRQSFNLLINLIAEHKMPDIVIFNDGFADTYVLCNPLFTSSVNGHSQEKIISNAMNKRKGHYFTNTFLAPLLAVPGKIFKKGKYKVPLACTTNPTKADEVAYALFENWQMAADLVHSRGGKFIAILQPTAYETKSPVSGLRLKTKRKNKILGPAILAIYARIRQKIRTKKTKWLYDFTSVYDNAKKHIFFDNIHVAAQGNEIYANELLRTLKQSQ